MINKCINYIQNNFLPQSCLVCNHPTHRPIALCINCEARLPYNTHYCRSCAVPLADSDQQLCASCQTSKPVFHHCHIPLLYRDPVSNWIQRFKFNSDLTKGKIIADIFCNSLKNNDISQIDILVPVPLHPSRTRQRGYNQSLWLANQISIYTQIPVDNKLVHRARNTLPQTELNHQQRLKNLREVFRLSGECKYKNVVVIDDVVTTGSTINEIATILTVNGVETVHAWAMARTVPKPKQV